MLAYIGPIIVLVTGVLGIFFSKAGERQRLSPVAFLLLGLVVLSGVLSVYGVYAAAADARDKANAARAREIQAQRDAAVHAEQLRREKRASDTLRGLLLAKTFAPDDLPANGILTFDLPVSAAAQNGDEDGNGALWPLAGKGVHASKLSFDVEDVFELDYAMRPSGDGAVIDGDWYEYGPKTCRLVSDTGFEFEAAPGSACRRADGYRFNAALDRVPFQRPFLIEMPREAFWKTYSRIEQVQRGDKPLGQFVIEAASDRDVPALLAAAQQIEVSFKFFRNYRQRKAEGACATSLIVHLASSAHATKRIVTLEIGGMEDFDLNFCEINMAD